MLKRTKFGLSVLLSTSLLLQTLGEPSLLFAATSTPASNSTNLANPLAQQNPSLEVINQKIETVAKEKGIPSILLKAIAYKESAWRQFDSQGNPLFSGTGPHPAIGIMQIYTYQDSDLDTIQKLKTDIDFNLRRGADLLNEKWAMVPKIGDGDRNKLENWYFALWAYNNWSGKNNPNQVTLPQSSSSTTSSSSQGSTVPVSPTSISSTSGTSTGSSGTTGTTGTSGTSGDLPGSILPAYQDRLLNLLANPPAWLPHYIQAVNVTPIPASLLPVQGVPQATVQWMTPQPFHWGDLTAGNVPQIVPEWVRLQGTDRIDTALQQAKQGWPQGSTSVILARADDFPDALAGVPLAARLNAPVLLTSPKELDTRVIETLKFLHPQKIYLLGGPGAIGPEITAELTKNGWSEENIIRISGENRYATASGLALATAVTSLPGIITKGTISFSTIPQGAAFQNVPAVALVTGENFPDALSIASIAGVQKMPILLTSKEDVPAETLEALKRLHPAKVYLVGGEGVISPQVEQGLQKSLGLPTTQIRRLFGASRYDTMAAVAKEFSAEIQNLSFATGEDFPDALAGAALAVHQNSTVILVPKDPLAEYPTLKSWIEGQLQKITTQTSSNANPSSELFLFGGDGAVSSAREKELKDLLGSNIAKN